MTMLPAGWYVVFFICALKLTEAARHKAEKRDKIVSIFKTELIKNIKSLQRLNRFLESEDGVDVFTHPTKANDTAEIGATEEGRKRLLRELKADHIDFSEKPAPNAE